LSQLTMVFRML